MIFRTPLPCPRLAVLALLLFFALSPLRAGAEPVFAEGSRAMTAALTEDAPRLAETGYPATDPDLPVRVLMEQAGADVTLTLPLSELAKGPRVQLPILFETGSYVIDIHSLPVLEQLATALSSPALKTTRVRIKGFTDTAGEAEENLRLSLNRALAVKYFLIGQYRMDEARFEAMGLGEALPLASEATEAGRLANRRIEVERID